MSTQVIHGTAAEANESKTNGWVVGHFMPPGLVQSDEFEIKLWHYDGNSDYPMKEFGGTEFIIIYGGVLRIYILTNGMSRNVYLRGDGHEYVVLPPGTTKQVFVMKAPAFGVTVRWPSGPGVSKVL